MSAPPVWPISVFRSALRRPAALFPSALVAVALALALGGATGCGSDQETSPDESAASGAAAAASQGPATPPPVTDGEVRVFSAPLLWDGTGAEPIPDAVLVTRGGRVESVGPRGRVTVPAGAQEIALGGAFVMPGFINAHGHAAGVRGAESGAEHYTQENLLRQLALYARYGVTTVASMGGDGPEAVALRDGQDRSDLSRARIYLAGPILTPRSPDEVDEQFQRLEGMEVDWVKFRVDDSLGRTTAMDRDTYRALIREAEARGIPTAVHMVDLEHSRGLVEEGAAILAHSIRDELVDDDLVQAVVERGVCLTPTLTRELSVFVYGERPDFFDDPFFLAEADPEVMEVLMDPARQAAVRESEAARWFEAQLPVAMENLRRIHEGGGLVALGTDSGPVGRFQGYFEHLEMEMMVQSGLSPEAVLRSATGEAARCLGLEGTVGTLVPGAWGDLVVLDADPRDDIRNTRTLRSVWISSNRVR
ncbi:MAG: hypothetical protein EA422_05845 [Gemmatimonadales bacterium]|nr:MAG: hypothetical protein EA422_05845 [Gemmatimonadales bacterium]